MPSLEDGELSASRTPHLVLAGFSGSLELLLALARAERIDLAGISLSDLLDQLADALDRDSPLLEKADWVVIASRVLQLRSRLLLPREHPEQTAAEAEAGQLRGRLAELEIVQALAAWLDARPQLGRDVFVRGQPEWIGDPVGGGLECDVIEFLWAATALFDDAKPDTQSTYQPRPPDLHSIAAARERIRQLLADAPAGLPLSRLLPAARESPPESRYRRVSAWSSTFVAGLELAKQGDVTLDQEDAFGPMTVRPAVISIPA